MPDDGTLPPLWHWIYLLERRRQRDLGPDGHPTTGIPAPPGAGRRRMFAGGRVVTHRPLVLGEQATRTTRVASSVEKQGRSGPLTFVTVRNEVTQGGQVAVVDEQDIVYRAPGSSPAPTGTAEPATVREPSITLEVDAALLFRFSALTYNAHRIHYDEAYATQVEGHGGLVVHGPLLAVVCLELPRRAGLKVREVSFRARRPVYARQPFTAAGSPEGGLSVEAPGGGAAMTAAFA
jgi:3-methylfumaryl-CoA hydratase